MDIVVYGFLTLGNEGKHYYQWSRIQRRRL